MSSLQARFSVSGPNNLILNNREKVSVSGWSSLQFRSSNAKEIWGKTLEVSDQKGFGNGGNRLPNLDPVFAQGMHSYWNHQKWWEKNLQPNMIEINSAQELVDNLLNAEDKFVIVHFFSPGCLGCKSLHPKICQIAESNPDAIFLSVNHEEHRAMCYALRVHVLPFFSFYRGAEGRVLSFSCTVATIKKFRDAMAKHGTERCSLGPAKGLDRKDLLALAKIKLIDFEPPEEENVEELVETMTSNAFSRDESNVGPKEGKAMVTA